jgi:hypothetical protein
VKGALTAVAIAAFVLTASACGGKKQDSESSRKITAFQLNLPPDVVGLKVKAEDITSALKSVKPSYVKEAALYSLRNQEDLVQATLQVSRFKDDPRFSTSDFRRTIITQIGSSPPRETRMGRHVVWRTSGSKAALAIWFGKNSMYLLSIRDDFAQPRTLIRTLIDLNLTSQGV